MDNIAYINARENEFDQFLYAMIGEDQNGRSVTVISGLARLSLDPRHEALELAKLSRSKARARLAGHLLRLPDIPELAHQEDAIANRLIQLLPGPHFHTSRRNSSSGIKLPAVSLGSLVAVIVLAFVLAQLFGFSPWN